MLIRLTGTAQVTKGPICETSRRLKGTFAPLETRPLLPCRSPSHRPPVRHYSPQVPNFGLTAAWVMAVSTPVFQKVREVRGRLRL